MRHTHKLQYAIFAGDIAWALLALVLAYITRFGFHWYLPAGGTVFAVLAPWLIVVVLWAILFFGMQLDGFRRGWHSSAVLSQLFVALCFLMLMFMAGGYFFRVFLSRLFFVYYGVFLFVGFCSVRYLTHAILGSKYFAGAVRRVVIVGNDLLAREMATKIERHPEMLCKLVGFLYSADTSFDPRIPADGDRATTVQTLGVIELLRESSVDEVIITSAGPANMEIMSLAARCRNAGIGVSIVPHPYELYLSTPRLVDLGGLPVLQLQEPKNPRRDAFKRPFDLLAAFVMLILSAPVIAMGALALLGRRGGPFIREARCGQYGKQFWMYRLNSDRDCPDVPAFEYFLQQVSITELPQLVNVIRGEMTLVGPRPESPERVKHYSDWQRQRLRVKPGITGLGQVSGLREKHSSEEKTRFDLQYMMHASLLLDISLILQTFWTLVGRISHLSRSRLPEADSPQPTQPIERIFLSADSTQSGTD